MHDVKNIGSLHANVLRAWVNACRSRFGGGADLRYYLKKYSSAFDLLKDAIELALHLETVTGENVKFMWNGIKVDGRLYTAWYSTGPYTKESGLHNDTITVRKKDYGSFPDIPDLIVENDSDLMTDYFEKDRIRIAPGSKYYEAANNAMKKLEEHKAKAAAKRGY